MLLYQNNMIMGVIRCTILLIIGLFISIHSYGQESKYQTRGYSQSFDVGGGLRAVPWYKYGSESLFVNYRGGYQLNSAIFAGLELGYLRYTRESIYHDFPKEMLSFGVVPIEVTYGKKEWKRLFSFLIGTAYDLEDRLKNNGLRLQFQFGRKKLIFNKVLMRASLAYEHHGLDMVERDPYIDWRGAETFSRNSLKFQVGIQF